jgi:thiamine phosphate synthase YjbQ (UPF0047 family)
MQSYGTELCFSLPERRDFINITPQVEECLRESGIKEGMAPVSAMHITASVFINDDESGLHHDYEVWLEELGRMRRSSSTGTTAPVRTPVRNEGTGPPMRTSSGRSWAARWWSP